jgi:hypothetical protein
MSKMKEFAWDLHSTKRCDPSNCAFCEAAEMISPPPLGSPETGSNHVSRAGRESSPGMMIAHTIHALREWDEEDLAVMLTQAVIDHDPDLVGAAAAGWLS